MEPEAGFEPATCSLRVSCSAELSYPGNGEKCYPSQTVSSNVFANLLDATANYPPKHACFNESTESSLTPLVRRGCELGSTPPEVSGLSGWYR